MCLERAKMEAVTYFISLGSKVTEDNDCSHEIKRHLLIGRKVMANLDSILKNRYLFANKGPYSQNYAFSSNHIQMWELDHKADWVPKNYCFQNVVLEKTLESPLDSEEIKPVNPKGNQPWIFTGRTNVKAEASILWPPDVKNWLMWKDTDAGEYWRQNEKWATEDEMVGWHHQFNRHVVQQTPGDNEGQGRLVCCSPYGHKESDKT